MKKIDVADIELKPEDRSEVLRYLGYSGQIIEEPLEKDIEAAIQAVNDSAEPRILYKIYDIAEDGDFKDDLHFLEGDDIRRHLSGCNKVLLMAATIGMKTDLMIRQAAIRNPIQSIIMDSAGSTLIELVCDTVEAELREEVEAEGQYLTSRFSPGYGDLPLHAQKGFFDALEIRRIGIHLSEDDLMTPRKSVTAVLGIADHPVKKKERSCNSCNLRECCRFRARGNVCGE